MSAWRSVRRPVGARRPAIGSVAAAMALGLVPGAGAAALRPAGPGPAIGFGVLDEVFRPECAPEDSAPPAEPGQSGGAGQPDGHGGDGGDGGDGAAGAPGGDGGDGGAGGDAGGAGEAGDAGQAGGSPGPERSGECSETPPSA